MYDDIRWVNSFLQEKIGELEQTVEWLTDKVKELETGMKLQVSLKIVFLKIAVQKLTKCRMCSTFN